MTPKSSGCPSNGYAEPFLPANEECKSSLRDTVASSICINPLAIDSMCSISAEKGNLYKRRKMDEECKALLANENKEEGTVTSCAAFGENTSSAEKGDAHMYKRKKMDEECKALADAHLYKRRKMDKECEALLANENKEEGTLTSCDAHMYKRKKMDEECKALADAHLYKLRKMDKECEALLANENKEEGTVTSCTTFGENTSLVQNDDGKPPFLPLNASFPNCEVSNLDFVMEYKEHVEASNGHLSKTPMELHSGVDDRLSSSVSGMPSSLSLAKKDVGECSSSNTNVTKPISELPLAKKHCTSQLGSDEFPNNVSGISITSGSIKGSYDKNAKYMFTCKSCGFLEDPLRMLICDSCEAAFHLSCCYPRIKEVPTAEEWYCLGCLRKKPKSPCGKLLTAKGGPSEHIQRARRGLGPIEFMLNDIEPHVSDVRIGTDFQAEVSEWSGPTSSDNDSYFGESFEVLPTELANLDAQYKNKHGIGNWIQCRDVLDTEEKNKAVICGKWRRAPLFVVQSSDWDCSCSVTWDPFHADCAVPQELETAEVLRQLKYINTLKNRLVDRTKKPS